MYLHIFQQRSKILDVYVPLTFLSGFSFFRIFLMVLLNIADCAAESKKKLVSFFNKCVNSLFRN